MSKRAFKVQASSSRAAAGSTAFLALNGSALRSTSADPSSLLSYIYEPPDVSTIEDANIAIALKNLQKKDSITKSKALEEIQKFTSRQPDTTSSSFEPSFLEAWKALYPRTSIDNSRRVRQLAHTIQGQIAAFCKKSYVKYLATSIGPWLAGLYDNDKSVSRAAQEAIRHVFPTEDKFQALWRVYQLEILDYCTNFVESETSETLSDSRNTSPDECVAKYVRTLSTTILSIRSLIVYLIPVDAAKCYQNLTAFLLGNRIWNLASHEDAFVRKSVLSLLISVIEIETLPLDAETLSNSFLTQSLDIDQTGSALAFVGGLQLLTASYPSIWTSHYRGKGRKSALSRLCRFFKRGSQGAPPQYWTLVSCLLEMIPDELFKFDPTEVHTSASEVDSTSSLALCQAMRKGILQKADAFTSTDQAWMAYLTLIKVLYEHNPILKQDQNQSFWDTNIWFLISQLGQSAPDQLQPVTNRISSTVALGACRLSLQLDFESFRSRWQLLGSRLIDELKLSQPESSKDHFRSQTSLAQNFDHYYSLQAEFMNQLEAVQQQNMLAILLSQLKSIMDVLRARNGKPFGGALAILKVASGFREQIATHLPLQEEFQTFASHDIPLLMVSPSSTCLIKCLLELSSIAGTEDALGRSAETLLAAPSSTDVDNALQALFSLSNFEEFRCLPRLFSQFFDASKPNCTQKWQIVSGLLENRSAPTSLRDHILDSLARRLSIGDDQYEILQGFDLISTQSPDLLKDYANTPAGIDLVTNIVQLADTDTSDNNQIVKLSQNVRAKLLNDPYDSRVVSSSLAILNKGFTETNDQSLPVSELSKQAIILLRQRAAGGDPPIENGIFPTTSQLNSALEPLIAQRLNPSLTTVNGLGHAMHLIEYDTEAAPNRDGAGKCLALRLTLYLLDVLQTNLDLNRFSLEMQASFASFLTIISLIASDNISVPDTALLQVAPEAGEPCDIARLCSTTQNIVKQICHHNDTSTQYTLKVQQYFLDHASALTSSAYYHARAYQALLEDSAISHAWKPPSSLPVAITKCPQEFGLLATAAHTVSERLRLQTINELISTLTGASFGPSNYRQNLWITLLLNMNLKHGGSILEKVPKQRVIFMVKHLIVEWQNVSSILQAEILVLMVHVLPQIKDTYDEFWEDVLTSCISAVRQEATDICLSLITNAVRLILRIQKPDMLEDGNEDLSEAWEAQQIDIAESLVDLATKLAAIPDQMHQPRRILASLVGRSLQMLSSKVVLRQEQLYPILASQSTSLQIMSYNVLQHVVKQSSEQIALEKAVDDKYEANISAELLSLVMKPDLKMEALDIQVESTDFAALQTYLLSWKLIFAHWDKSGVGARSDFIKSIAEGGYLPHFLVLICELLDVSSGKMVDAAKFKIESFDFSEVSSEKTLQSLAINLYYEALRYIPSLVKTWWRDDAMRHVKIALEGWTEKHISPLIIALELGEVGHWAGTQTADDSGMEVKVSQTTRDIVASIPIDEQFCTMGITFPAAYPLFRAEAMGLRRLAVAETRWHNWIRNAQGQLTVSDGGSNSLIECLLAWKRNVTLAMKGQTECAICYSVVGADKSLPKKECPTCKQRFHAACLYRWFKSSNSSSCPLCRNTFTYS